jgi:hypothetical protein
MIALTLNCAIEAAMPHRPAQEKRIGRRSVSPWFP